MNPEAPLVSVCMVTFGAFERVRAAIESVRRHTTVPYQLIVVDNGSTDGTRDWLRHHLTDHEYIESATNSGFSGGNNLAVNRAIAPFVCLLNSDTIVPAHWLEPLVEAFADDPDLGIAIPLLLNSDGSVQEAGCNTDSDGRAEPLFYGVDSDHEQLRSPRSIAYGSAACWLLRTATYRRFGGLDCGYGLAYYEDVDFAFTLRAHRLRIQFVPDVKVVHAQGASSDPKSAEALRDAQQYRFARRHATDLAHHSHIYDLDNEPHRFAAARDVDCAVRTLHIFKTVDETTAKYQSISDAPPFASGHHTLCTEDSQTPSLVSHRADIDIQAAGAARVVEEQIFHFSEIVAHQSWLDANRALIQATQPQSDTSLFSQG